MIIEDGAEGTLVQSSFLPPAYSVQFKPETVFIILLQYTGSI